MPRAVMLAALRAPVHRYLLLGPRPLRLTVGTLSSSSSSSSSTVSDQSPEVTLSGSTVAVNGEEYRRDNWTNVTPRVMSKLNAQLLNRRHHPLQLLKERIRTHFYDRHQRKAGAPLFSVFDHIGPVVTPQQNFDSLLVPADHVSRSPKDAYYVNQDWMLRSHCTAHDAGLINMGVDAFLVFGDVYRRDAIDATHYPVFHQADGVRLYSAKELFVRARDPDNVLQLMEPGGARGPDRQEDHTMETAKMLEFELKATLESLTTTLFGPEVEFRWVDAFFPFTHPSWEMEVRLGGEWVEMLGCGILEQRIINEAGALGKVGWAFGLGMERWAMRLYGIPDIRIFWSTDPGVTRQFEVDDVHQAVTFKPVSVFPPCITDLSFWLPSEAPETFSHNDFYDLVRSVGGDQVEQVRLIDEFVHPKTRRHSHCYRITYRDMARTLSQEEVNRLHATISRTAADALGVEIR